VQHLQFSELCFQNTLRWNCIRESSNVKCSKLSQEVGRDIAQAISRRLPTAAALVRAQVTSCGIRGGQSGTGPGFLRVLTWSDHSARAYIVTKHSLSQKAITLV
jgi:hypothetical protein